MSVVEVSRARPSVTAVVQYTILGFIALAALASAFTHMHDWTLRAVDAAMAAHGLNGHTPGWVGWANAVISELMPVSSFLSLRQRQVQKRSTAVPAWIFVASFVVSVMAQLSATGISVVYGAELLVTLPALATLALAKVIFADIEYAAEVRKKAERAAELAAELAAERARKNQAQEAELARQRAREDAELAAELARKKAEHAEELARRRAREDAELSAELARQAAELAAELERERLKVEQAAMTERERITAQDRERERAARERRELAEREVRRAAEAERAQARAAVLEAGVGARSGASGQVAASRGRRDAEVEVVSRRRRSREETQALVAGVLDTLEQGLPREAAVTRVAQALEITPRYAREFVPEGWGSVDGVDGRRLVLVGAS